MRRITTLAGVFLLGLHAHAQEPEIMTLESALELARQQAPAIIAARLRIEESRARVIGASLPFLSNPAVGFVAGRRSGGVVESDEYEVDVEQEIDLPSRRRARLDAARAGITQEEQRASNSEREVLRDVATTFFSALAARERLDVSTNAKQLDDDALRIADRRFKAGDVAQLDVNVARTAVARAGGEVLTATTMLNGQLVKLKMLLGIPAVQQVTISGALRDAAPIDGEQVIKQVLTRPDLRLLDAEIAQVEAELRLARTLRWPELGVRGSYSQEEGDHVVLGGVGLTLPIINRGQEATAVATARLNRVRSEHEALLRSIEAEVAGALSTYESLRTAAAEYERTVLPLVVENEALILESYDGGQIGLADLLIVRRDALETRRAFIDQLFALRIAEIELRAQTGVWK